MISFTVFHHNLERPLKIGKSIGRQLTSNVLEIFVFLLFSPVLLLDPCFWGLVLKCERVNLGYERGEEH